MIASAGTIEEFARGTWVADVESDDDAAGTFRFAAVTWVGRIDTATRESGRTRARIVGGTADLGATVPNKWYLGGATGNTIIRDIASVIGAPVDVALPARVASWQRAESSAGEALDSICDALGVDWWIDRDGVLRAGARDYGLVSASRVETGADGIVTLASDSAAGVAPGRTLASGAIIGHVRHMLSSTGLRCEVSVTPLRVREPSGLAYLRMHRGVVERQHDDGTLDLIVDNAFSLTRIPWLPGGPMSCTLLAGDVVQVVSWAGGDPRQWAAVGVSRVPDLAPVAGAGDSVDCGTLILGFLIGIPPGSATTASAQYVPPTPVDTFAARLAAAQAALTAFPVQFSFPLAGIITSGNPRILAGINGAALGSQ